MANTIINTLIQPTFLGSGLYQTKVRLGLRIYTQYSKPDDILSHMSFKVIWKIDVKQKVLTTIAETH